MKKLVSFMHTSLDGYAAGPHGEMDWILIGNEMFDYAYQQTQESDVALYGRVTYQLMDAYWPTAADKPNATRHDIEHSNWYNAVTKIVVSKTMKDTNRANTKIISDNLVSEIKKLKSGIGKNIVMFGSPKVTRILMAENLVDIYWLFVNPILLGKGIPLFQNFDNSIKLKLLQSKTFSTGVVCLQYEANTTK